MTSDNKLSARPNASIFKRSIEFHNDIIRGRPNAYLLPWNQCQGVLFNPQKESGHVWRNSNYADKRGNDTYQKRVLTPYPPKQQEQTCCDYYPSSP